MKTIEFQQSIPGELDLINPWHTYPGAPYQDLLLKPDYARLKHSIPSGKSTIRVLPALKGSTAWAQTIHVLQHHRGKHPHLKSSYADATSVYDKAIAWLTKNEPAVLRSKSNPSGHRLTSTPYAAFWVLVGDSSSPQLRILIAPAFAGSSDGKKPGLGRQIYDMVQDNPEIISLDGVFQIELTKTQPDGGRYPEYQVAVGHTETALQDATDLLSLDDKKLAGPLEDTVRQIDAEHEWVLLGDMIGNELRDKIRAASTTA